MTYRSLLFVPGNRPERFRKALAAGADTVCIDLEDAVPPDQKDLARTEVAAALNTPGAPFGVRINSPSGPLAHSDAAALGGRLAFVMVPKVEHADQMIQVADCLLHGTPLWAVIESAEGLRQAWDIAAAPGLAGLLFGGADYAADLGCTMDWEPLLYARGRLAAVAARAGVQLLDVPHLDIADDVELTTTTVRVKAMGFTGRACIHPAQVASVNAIFTPAPGEIARARRVVQAFENANGAAALLDGKLIELPLIRSARRILERAGDR